MTSKYLFWCDIETTSNNAKIAQILEIAGIVTTKNLFPVARFHEIVHHERGSLDKFLSEWSVIQHSSSGLLEECYRSGVPFDTVEVHLYEFLDQFRRFSHTYPRFLVEHTDQEHSISKNLKFSNVIQQQQQQQQHNPALLRLAGSGIAFDRECLEYKMPRIAAMFHHQLNDVTVMLHNFGWYAPRWHAYKPLQMHRQDHRAAQDIEDSLKLAQFYRQCLLTLNTMVPNPQLFDHNASSNTNNSYHNHHNSIYTNKTSHNNNNIQESVSNSNALTELKEEYGATSQETVINGRVTELPQLPCPTYNSASPSLSTKLPHIQQSSSSSSHFNSSTSTIPTIITTTPITVNSILPLTANNWPPLPSINRLQMVNPNNQTLKNT